MRGNSHRLRQCSRFGGRHSGFGKNYGPGRCLTPGLGGGGISNRRDALGKILQDRKTEDVGDGQSRGAKLFAQRAMRLNRQQGMPAKIEKIRPSRDPVNTQ